MSVETELTFAELLALRWRQAHLPDAIGDALMEKHTARCNDNPGVLEEAAAWARENLAALGLPGSAEAVRVQAFPWGGWLVEAGVSR